MDGHATLGRVYSYVSKHCEYLWTTTGEYSTIFTHIDHQIDTDSCYIIAPANGVRYYINGVETYQYNSDTTDFPFRRTTYTCNANGQDVDVNHEYTASSLTTSSCTADGTGGFEIVRNGVTSTYNNGCAGGEHGLRFEYHCTVPQ